MDDARGGSSTGAERPFAGSGHAYGTGVRAQEIAALFEQSPLPSLLVDRETLRIAAANAAATRRLGFSSATVTSLRFPDLLPAQEGDTASTMAHRSLIAADLVRSRGRWELMRRTGGTETFHVATEPFTFGGRATFLLYAAPEPAHPRPEEGFMPLAPDSLLQFSFSAFHDLKEPLHLVRGYLNLLQQRAGPALDPEARECLTFALTGAERLQETVVTMLEYFRIETRPPKLEPVPLAGVVAEAAANLRLLVRETGADLRIGALPEILGDRFQLLRLFQNLLGNGIKFHGEANPRVAVEARAVPDGWDVTVSDNGVGIDPRDHERIFRPFQRVYSQDQFPGTGLGLATCRRIAEAHRARVWVDSSLGRGATFHVHFPKGPEVT